MSGKRYTEKFKVVAVKQVIDREHPAAEVAERPGDASRPPLSRLTLIRVRSSPAKTGAIS